jgi:hypothetical protein
MEDSIAEGITVAMTIGFTVPQAIAIAERHLAGIRRARAIGIQPGKCFAVVMIGRIERLCRMPEFVRAYEPDGMDPSEFVAFGATQRTLSQFVEAGWKLMENYR